MPGPSRSARPERLTIRRARAVQLRDRQPDAAGREVRARILQCVDRRGVELADGAGIQQQPLGRRRGPGHARQQAVLDIFRIEEDERSFRKIDGEARDRGGIGMPMQLVEALAARDAAEQGIARLRGDPDQMRQGGQDGEDDAPQHPEAEHAQDSDDGEQELDPAEAPQDEKARGVDEVEGGGDEDRAQDGDGQPGQGLPEEEHDGHEGCGRDEPGELGLAADGVVHRGAGIRAGDRKAAEQAGGDIGGAEADQLAVGVDVIAVLEAEASRRDDAAAEADQQDAEHGERKIVEVEVLGQGQREDREAARYAAHELHAQRLEIEGAGQQESERDRDEGTGKARRQAAQDAQQ